MGENMYFPIAPSHMCSFQHSLMKLLSPLLCWSWSPRSQPFSNFKTPRVILIFILVDLQTTSDIAKQTSLLTFFLKYLYTLSLAISPKIHNG